MDMKMILGVAIIIAIVAGAGFYGGMTYAKAGVQSDRAGQFAGGQFTGERGAGNRAPGGAGGGFTTGEIISLGDESLTIKMPDGSTKIVLLAESTAVTKSVPGNRTDLTQGTQISVTGEANQDGSVTAQTISIGGGFGGARTSGGQTQ